MNDMKAASRVNLKNEYMTAVLLSILIGVGLSLFTSVVFGQQQPQLRLADILIGLRSKKVTLPERNKLLTEAVLARGVTFSLTTEIEKELEGTGANKGLVDSIRKKNSIIKTSAIVSAPVQMKPNPVVAASPAPPDFNFYLKRAQANSEKGDSDAALVDYGKAIEMKPDFAEAFLDRGFAHLNKKAIESAISDFSKAIELNPRSAAAFAARGDAFEKKGDVQKAKADYQKALELDANIEPAKGNLSRIVADELNAQKQAEEARKLAEQQQPVKVEPKAPDLVDLGQIYSSLAVKMVVPVYSQVALKAGIQGRVKVEIMIDEEGNVTSAKAVEGHQFLRLSAEDAARRSKFKPAMYDGKPIKAKGYILYNFTPTGR